MPALYLGILLYCDRRHHESQYISIDIVLYYMNIKISRICIAAVHCVHCIKSSPLSPVHCSVVCQVARSIIEAESRTQAEFRDLGVLMTITMRYMTPAWTRATCHVTSSCAITTLETATEPWPQRGTPIQFLYHSVETFAPNVSFKSFQH